MTLTVEDGSQVANSNTYVDDSEYVAYAAARGKTIGATSTLREIELIKAMDYIEGHRAEFKGSKVASTQSLQWPRFDVWIDGFVVDSDEIPAELENAQMEAAIITYSTELLTTGSVSDVKMEKVDVLEVEYFQGGSWETTRTDTVDVYLNILLKGGGSGINARGTRA